MRNSTGEDDGAVGGDVFDQGDMHLASGHCSMLQELGDIFGELAQDARHHDLLLGAEEAAIGIGHQT